MTISGRVLRTALSSVVLATIALSASASSVVVRDQYNDLLGNATVNKVTVHSVVTKDLTSGIFTYDYSLNYISGTGLIHFFGVENPCNTPFFATSNNVNFIDPAYTSGAYEILWQNKDDKAFIPVGGTGNFSYQSVYGPMDINVYAWVTNSGGQANGVAVGMGDMVPEPGSILALSCGLLAMAPAVIRRRKQTN